MSLYGYIPKTKPAPWRQAFPEQYKATTKKPRTIKPRKSIRHESKKRSSERRIYSVERIKFLAENPICMRTGCTAKATEVHHFAGRGIFYLNEATWRSSCHDCNMFAKENPKAAIAEGWRAPVGVYRT